MIYEIQSKSDLQIGAMLTVSIPETDLDHKAMNTILSDRPDFVLPFRHRAVDGQVEFTYQIGGRSKLTYLSGSRSPFEYAALWSGLLQPLLDCSDWFMTPYSFVLSAEHLYCDKAAKAIGLVYIPSRRPCSDSHALKQMVTEVARQNHVSDIGFENKVMWAIQEFSIKGFLQMVADYRLQPGTVGPQGLAFAPPAAPVQAPSRHAAVPPILSAPAPKAPAPTSAQADDIAIHFPTDGKAPKQKGGLFGPKKEKPPKPEPREKGGLWGKKNAQPEFIAGAAALPPRNEAAPVQPARQAIFTPSPACDDDATQLDAGSFTGPRFRYVGAGGHPAVIQVEAGQGAVFTIGRFDASVGKQQSHFEFDKRTKAVSRRHAAVEKGTDGYSIVDLDSGAGTFLNGQKLPPNASFRLERGCRVSFGTAGADYIWEE